MTNSCNGCSSFKTNNCHISYDLDCPCKLCLLKGNCTATCDKRRDIFDFFITEHLKEYIQIKQERKKYRLSTEKWG